MIFENCSIGRTQIVAFHNVDGAKLAALSFLLVEWDHDSESQISFKGSGVFSSSTQNHIKNVVFPLVTKILNALNVAITPIAISLVNISAASIRDIPIGIVGYSADLSIFLAILSRYLNIPLEQDFVITGHISSNQGDMALPQAIPEKILGTLQYPAIKRFICPDPDAEPSIHIFHREELDQIRTTIADNKKRLRFHFLRSLCDLFGIILKEEHIIYGLLKTHSFNHDYKALEANPRTEFISNLTLNEEERFWNVTSKMLFSDKIDAAQALLDLRLDYHSKIQSYPDHFGSRFQNLLRSLPRTKRPPHILGRFISAIQLNKLAALAAEDDLEDFQCFVESLGDANAIPSEALLKRPSSDKEYDLLLDFLFQELDEKKIANTITIPIHNARMDFTYNKVIIDDYNEFLDLVSAFYTYMLVSTEKSHRPIQAAFTAPEAIHLLKRAFQSQEGVEIAFKEAQKGIQGGVRFVLDQMANQLIREKKEEHIEYVLAEILDPTVWPDHVKLGEAILRRFYHLLPPEIQDMRPEDVALEYNKIIRYLLQVIDQVRKIFNP